MAANGPVQEAGDAEVSRHEVMPQDFLTFYEFDEFADNYWKSLGSGSGETTLGTPNSGSWLIQRVRRNRTNRWIPSKRFGAAAWKVGKRGGVRVCYVYFEEHSVVLL